MEILDYFKAIGKRFWVLVLVPLIAGFLPLAWFVLKPTRYAAKVTIIPTSLVGGVRSNQYRGSDADKFFANNVTGALRTNRLVDQVSQETSVPAHQVRGGLSVTQVNGSAFVDVTYLRFAEWRARSRADAHALAAHRLRAAPHGARDDRRGPKRSVDLRWRRAARAAPDDARPCHA